MKAGGVKAL